MLTKANQPLALYFVFVFPSAQKNNVLETIPIAQPARQMAIHVKPSTRKMCLVFFLLFLMFRPKHLNLFAGYRLYMLAS